MCAELVVSNRIKCTKENRCYHDSNKWPVRKEEISGKKSFGATAVVIFAFFFPIQDEAEESDSINPLITNIYLEVSKQKPDLLFEEERNCEARQHLSTTHLQSREQFVKLRENKMQTFLFSLKIVSIAFAGKQQ